MVIPVGNKVPDFTLSGVIDGEITKYMLSDYASEKPVVLLFYVYDFSPVCTEQLCEVNDTEFLTFNDDIRVLGISTDGPYSHKEFSLQKDISYPLLTDDGREIYETCGLLDTSNGIRESKRGMVLVDQDLEVKYSWEADDNWDDWNISILTDLVDAAQDAIHEKQ